MNYLRRYRYAWIVITLGSGGFGSLAHAADTTPYGAYMLNPQGSRRVNGMGGAFVGLADDAQAVQYNPSGLTFLERSLAIGANYNNVYNAEANVDGRGTYNAVPFAYVQGAAVYRLGNIGFGAGLSASYLVNQGYAIQDGAYANTVAVNLSLNSYDAAFAYRVTDDLSIGVSLHLLKLTEKFHLESTDLSAPVQDVQTSVLGFAPDIGVSYRSVDDWGLGFAFAFGRSFAVDPNLNQRVSLPWFRGVVIPPKLTLGGFIKINEQIMIVSDIDFFFPPGNAVYVGSLVAPGFSQIALDNSPKVVLHGGAQYHFINSNTWDLYFRAGTYVEPPRIMGSATRLHGTTGIELRYWVFAPSAAVDFASGYVNYSIGLDLSLKPFD